MYSSMRTGALRSAWSASIRSISSLIEPATALNAMPIDPSSRLGFTITGKCTSSAHCSRPWYTVAKLGVRIPWNAKRRLATALSWAR